MKFSDLSLQSLLWGFFSVLPWLYALWATFPRSTNRLHWQRLLLVSILAFLGGILATYLILEVNPLLWPSVELKARKPKSLLTQTIHLAFIQAGMVEEFFKISIILLLGFLFLRNPDKTWNTAIFLVAGCTALGFAFIENSYYIISEIPERRLDTFIGRAMHSSNIHLLINLCFALFCIKSNYRESGPARLGLLGFAFLLAVVQHGVVDFFLIPASSIGAWIATAMFVGIWVWVVRDFRYYVLGKKWEPI